MRLLGIDYGRARIGLALGDTETGLAGPFDVLKGKGSVTDDAAQVAEVAAREGIDATVVGIPRPMGNQTGASEQTEEVFTFVAALRERGVVVHEENEIMTSQLAARQMQDRGQKGKRDDLAAAVILQSWLDRG